MKHTFGRTVLMISVLAVVASGCSWLNFEPTRQPSPVPSPTTATSSAPPSPSSSSRPTATTTTPSPSPGGQVTPVPVRTPPPEPIVVGGSGATDLRSEGFCEPESPSTAAMALTWRPGGAGEQLVAVSTRPDGFDTGRYTVSENLPAQRREYTISPVEPGGVYYWRVLTRSGDRWMASAIATFTGPTCVIDTP